MSKKILTAQEVGIKHQGVNVEVTVVQQLHQGV